MGLKTQSAFQKNQRRINPEGEFQTIIVGYADLGERENKKSGKMQPKLLVLFAVNFNGEQEKGPNWQVVTKWLTQSFHIKADLRWVVAAALGKPNFTEDDIEDYDVLLGRRCITNHKNEVGDEDKVYSKIASARSCRKSEKFKLPASFAISTKLVEYYEKESEDGHVYLLDGVRVAEEDEDEDDYEPKKRNKKRRPAEPEEDEPEEDDDLPD